MADGYLGRMAWLSLMWLRVRGWRFVGSAPDDPKYVIIGYPHTSNWDFFIYLAAIRHFHLDVRFLGHEGLWVGPFGWVLDRLGGIPVSRGSTVDDAVALFDAADRLLLAISPEGTRAGGGGWRSGFWRIAEQADVPVLIGYVDGPSRTIGLGPCTRIDGDPERWMSAARAFLADKQGLKPHNRGLLELAD